MANFWTDDNIKKLEELYARGHSYKDILRILKTPLSVSALNKGFVRHKIRKQETQALRKKALKDKRHLKCYRAPLSIAPQNFKSFSFVKLDFVREWLRAQDIYTYSYLKQNHPHGFLKDTNYYKNISTTGITFKPTFSFTFYKVTSFKLPLSTTHLSAPELVVFTNKLRLCKKLYPFQVEGVTQE